MARRRFQCDTGVEADQAGGDDRIVVETRIERRILDHHHLVQVDARRKPDASLTGRLVMRMLNAIGLDDLYLVPDLHGKEHTINRIALFDLLQDAGVPCRKGCCLIKAFLNGFEKFVFHLACMMHREWLFPNVPIPGANFMMGDLRRSFIPRSFSVATFAFARLWPVSPWLTYVIGPPYV